MQKNNSRFSSFVFQFAVICFIAIFVIPVLLNYARPKIKNVGAGGDNIICFGDSITFGYGVNPGEDYPTALTKLLDIPVINAGVDGDTSNEGLKRIKKDVLEKKPHIVLIEFSGNDFLKKVPIYTTVANIREMIRQIQSEGAITAIVDVSAGLFMLDYRIELSKLAFETGSIFIPAALSGIITNPSMKSDFMHPNSDGYKMIAQRVYNALDSYLKE